MSGRISRLTLGALAGSPVDQRVARITIGVLHKPIVTGTPSASIFVTRGPASVVDTEDAYAVHRVVDPARRPAFEQSVLERDIAIGGCERNDELDLWAERHHHVQRLRGTTAGILTEVRRLTCSHDDVRLVVDDNPAEWFLDLTWPDLTPVWLDLTARLRRITVEFPYVGAPNWTPATLAAWIARHLLPKSTVELAYFAALATTLQADTTTPGPGLSRLVVGNTGGFSAGDEVEIRTADNARSASATVQSIIDATTMDVTSIGAFTAGDIVRTTLARS